MIRILLLFSFLSTGYCLTASWTVEANRFNKKNLKIKARDNSVLKNQCKIQEKENRYAVSVKCLERFPLVDLDMDPDKTKLIQLELKLWLPSDTPDREIILHSSHGVNRYSEWISLPNTLGLPRSQWTTLTWYFPHLGKSYDKSKEASHFNFSDGLRSPKLQQQNKKARDEFQGSYKLYDDEAKLFFRQKDLAKENPNFYIYDLEGAFISQIKVTEISPQISKKTDEILDRWIQEDTHSLLDKPELLVVMCIIFFLLTLYVLVTSPIKIASQLTLVLLPVVFSLFYTFPGLIFDLGKALDFSLKTSINRVINESYENILKSRKQAQRACIIELDSEIRKLPFYLNTNQAHKDHWTHSKWLELCESILRSRDISETIHLFNTLMKERGKYLKNYAKNNHPFWKQKLNEYEKVLNDFSNGTLQKDISKMKKLAKSYHPLCDQLNRIDHDYDTKIYLLSRKKYYQYNQFGLSQNSDLRQDFKVIAKRVVSELSNETKQFNDSSFEELRTLFQDYGGNVLDLHSALEEPLSPVSVLNSNISQTYEDFVWTWIELDGEIFFVGIVLQHRYVTHKTYELIKKRLLKNFNDIGLKVILKRRDWRRDYPRILYNNKQLMKFAAKIHHIDQEATEAVMQGDQKSILVGRRIPLARTFVCFDFSINSMLSKHKTQKNIVFWAILLGFIFVYGFINILANGLLKPLKQVDKNLNQVLQGNFEVQNPQFVPRDLNRLSFDLKLLIKELKETEDLTGFIADSAAKNIRDLRPTKLEEVCILFCGIFGLDKLNQDEQMDAVAKFLDQNQTILDKHGAMIDKFTGSACLAVFRESHIIHGPLHAAQEILNLNEQNKLPFDISIGLATGKTVMGHVGSSRRKDYTCIGDTVNLAARLETLSLSRDLPLNRVYLDKATYQNHQHEGWQFERLEAVAIKGKSKKQEVYVLQS